MIQAMETTKLGYRGVVMRERSNGSWVRAGITLTLDKFYVFADETVRPHRFIVLI